MEQWVNMVETNCDPTREEEYNDWYDGIHIPDILLTPGFVRAQRFVNKETRDGRGKYMALYEIATENIDDTMKVRLERRAEENRLGRGLASRTHFISVLWRDVLWKQIFERYAPESSTSQSGKWLNLVEQNCDPAREAEYHEWYNAMHIPDVLATPSFVSARRYQIKDFRSGRGKYLAIYGIETDDIENTMKARLQTRNDELKAGRAASNRPNLTRPVWRDVLWKQISEHRAQT